MATASLAAGGIPWRERLRRDLAVAGIAGPLAGIGGAIIARVAMRVFALAINRPVEFTPAGTIGIVVFGVVLGALAGLLFAAVRRVIPSPWPVAGSLVGIAASVLLVAPNLGGPGQEGSEDPLAARGLFAAVAIGGSLFQAWTASRIRRRFESGGWTEDGWPAVGFLVSVGTLLILATVAVTNLAGAVAGDALTSCPSASAGSPGPPWMSPDPASEP